MHLVRNWPRSVFKSNQTCLAQVPHLTMTDLKLSVFFDCLFFLDFKTGEFLFGSEGASLSNLYFFFTDM